LVAYFFSNSAAAVIKAVKATFLLKVNFSS